MPDTPQVSLYWILAAKVLNGIGVVVTLIFGAEFAMAQSPNRMRGIMTGLLIIIDGWSTLGSHLLTEIFHKFKTSYLFYFYLALPPLAMYCCQAIQAEREGEARQHTGHSGGTLREIL